MMITLYPDILIASVREMSDAARAAATARAAGEPPGDPLR